MAKQVKNTDIFEANLFKKTQEDVKALITEIDNLEGKLVLVAKQQKEILSQQDNKTIQSIQRTKIAVDKLNEAEKLTNNIRNQKIKLEQNLKQARKVAISENEQLKLLLAEQNKINKQLAREKLGLVGAYEKESKRLILLRKQYKDLALAEGETSVKAKQLLTDITALDSKLKQVDATVGQSQRNVGNYGSAWSRVGNTLKTGLGILGIGSAIAVIGRVIFGAVKTIREFDESVADLQKVTGLAKKDARELAEEITKIDTRTSVKSLLELATAGGRLGLTGRQLIEFTKSTDKAFVALGDSLDGTAEEIGLSLGKIAANFGAEQEFGIGLAIEKVGSSLNDLGAKSKASEGAILDFTTRLSGVASQSGITIAETNALGALFDEAGISAEISSSLIGKLLPAIGKDVKKFAKTAGVDVKTFSKLLADKPFEALQLVAKGAQSSQKGLEGLNKTLEGFGIKGGRGAAVVGILAGKQERLNELVEISNEAYEKATSLSDEFAVKNETLNARIDKLGNNWDKFILSVESGEGVLSDIFNGAIGGVNDFLVGLTKVDQALKKVTKRAIGGREAYLKSVEEFGLGFDGIASGLGKADKFIEKKTDEIAKAFIDKDEKTQRTIANNLLKRIKSDNKLLESTSGLEQLAVEKRINANLLLLSKLKVVRIAQKEGADEEIESVGKLIKQRARYLGIIEKQASVVSDLQEKIQRASIDEEQILTLSLQLDVEKEELARLNRIVSSTIEEINEIEIDLTEDQTQKRILLEEEKSRKLIEQIRTNSRAETKVKEELIQKEQERLTQFILNENINEVKGEIDQAKKLAEAEISQRKSGFKSQKEFDEFKAEQTLAIKRNSLQAELDVLEFYGREEDAVRREQLKGEIAELYEFEKEKERIMIDFLEVVAELVDKEFEKRIENIGKQIDKTTARIDQLREKANEGQLASQESLAFEQKREAELEKQRAREQKRQQKVQALFTVLSTFQANVNSGASNPLAKTFADVAVLKSLAGTLGSAYDGVDDTGDRGKVDSKGGKLWVLHPNEQVWSKKDRNDVGFRDRNEIKDIVKMYDNGMLDNLSKMDNSSNFINPSAFVVNGLDSNIVVNKLDQLNRTLKQMEIPKGMVNIDEVRKLITLTTKKGNQITKERSKLHS